MIGYENVQKAMGVNIITSNEMANAIYLWSQMYINRATWLTDSIRGIGLPAAIASEHARLVTMESKFNFPDTQRGRYIAEQFRAVKSMLPAYVEFGCAKGGFVMKPYVDKGKITVDFVHEDDFFPVTFNAGKVTAAMFPEYKKTGKKLYTRLEYHELTDRGYRIVNRAFASDNASVQVNNIVNLGGEIPLDKVEEWAGLAPEVEIQGVDFPLFAYFKVPIANSIDPHSPLGVSVYSRAVPLIQDADEQYGAAIWEYRSKETAIQAGAEYFERDRYNNILLPVGKERMFQSFRDTGDREKGLFNIFSPEIRDESFYRGLNRMLQRIEFNCGLAYGTLSDPQNVDKTAEEIKSSKQRSYAMVTSIQNALQVTLEDLTRAMDFWASYGGLAAEGKCDISSSWDDSVTTDAETKRKRDLEDVAAGILAPWEYRMKHYGEDEETAKARVPVPAGLIM